MFLKPWANPWFLLNDLSSGIITKYKFCNDFKGKWSEKPGSNRRPQPWQGCALPTELFSLSGFVIKRTFPDAVNAIIWCYPLPHLCYRGSAWSLHNSWDGFRLAAQYLSAKIERAFSCNHRFQQNVSIQASPSRFIEIPVFIMGTDMEFLYSGRITPACSP